MKFNRSFLIIGACILACTALIAAQTETDPSSSNNFIDNNENNGRSHRRSLFDFLMNPLKSTIEHTKKFFGRRIDNANDIYQNIPNFQVETFKMFMRLYNKTYPASEIPRRMALFFQRREAIEESQKLFEEGREMFAMRENEFTDWDDEELKKLAGVSLPSPDELDEEERSMYQLSNRFERSISSSDNATSNDLIDGDEIDLDEENMVVKAESATKDWRTSGCVSTPINQRKCGACYAIATMSVVETMRCLKTVSSPILSSQQIVDCASSRAGYANYGCDGGWPTRVLKYLQDHKIAAREKCYPFVRRQNACKLRQVAQKSGCTVSASWSGNGVQYKVLRNERDIQYHVANTGPVVTVMKASDKFLYYGKGIFDDRSCTNRRDDVDHAIVIVGYGKENGVDYWIIKNSWGTTEWGIDGYGLYRKGKNACSIGHWGWVVTG